MCLCCLHIKVKKAKIRNQYNHVPHLTQDIIWESDKNTRKYHLKVGLLIPRVVRQLVGYLGLRYFSILTGLLTLYFDSDLIFDKILIAKIRIHHECEGGIEKIVLRITNGHHEACRQMTNGDCKGRIFLSHPHT